MAEYPEVAESLRRSINGYVQDTDQLASLEAINPSHHGPNSALLPILHRLAYEAALGRICSTWQDAR